MKLSPKHIIWIAVSNYLTTQEIEDLKNEFIKYNRLTGRIFIELIAKYFDFKLLRDKPVIPEDIWLFNYLMYETNKINNRKIDSIGEIIKVSGGLKKTPLLKKYESKIIIPQLKALQATNMILSNLN